MATRTSAPRSYHMTTCATTASGRCGTRAGRPDQDRARFPACDPRLGFARRPDPRGRRVRRRTLDRDGHAHGAVGCHAADRTTRLVLRCEHLPLAAGQGGRDPELPRRPAPDHPTRRSDDERGAITHLGIRSAHRAAFGGPIPVERSASRSSRDIAATRAASRVSSDQRRLRDRVAGPERREADLAQLEVGAFEHPLRIGHEDAVLQAEVDVDRLRAPRTRSRPSGGPRAGRSRSAASRTGRARSRRGRRAGPRPAASRRSRGCRPGSPPGTPRAGRRHRRPPGRHRGAHVTIPTSLVPRPSIVQPSPRSPRPALERRLESRLLRPGRVDPQLASDESLERVARLEPARLDRDALDRRAPTPGLEQLEHVGQRRQRRRAPPRGPAARTGRPRRPGPAPSGRPRTAARRPPRARRRTDRSPRRRSRRGRSARHRPRSRDRPRVRGGQRASTVRTFSIA